MDINAELGRAVQQRFAKVHGVDKTPPISKPLAKEQNRRNGRRAEPTMARASKNEAKKAAAAAIMARMGGNRAPPPPEQSTAKKPKRRFKMTFSKPKVSTVTNPTSTGLLSKAEEETAQKYRKMMKMGLPEGAVRHKMNSDGVAPKIVEAVMSGEESSPSTTPIRPSSNGSSNAQTAHALSSGEEKMAEKYRKMVKIGMPEGAVLHKMIADGVPANIRDAVMAGEEQLSQTNRGSSASARVHSQSRAAATGGSQLCLSPQDEKIAAQYRRMLKIKMPEGAVRHKMIADGVSQKIQDSVMNGDVAQASSSPPAPQSSSRGGAAGPASSLSTQDEKVAAPYRKMIRMKMPEGAVRHKMTVDGISRHIQDSVLGGKVPSTSSCSRTSSFSRGGAAGPVSSLSREDETKATPYRKMIRMKMPEGAVRHKMTIDCIPEHIQSSVLNGEIPNEASEGGGDAPTPPMRPSANPLVAAISSSGGIGSLKKTTVSSETSERPPSNPMAAAIASSGGIKSLKKTTVNEKKPAVASASSNPLAAAIAASGGRSGLKKTPPKSNNVPPPKQSSGNSMLDELSARGFRNGLRKTTPPKKAVSSPPKSSIFMSVGDELSSNGVMSAPRRSSRPSRDESPDVSSRERPMKPTRSPEEAPERNNSEPIENGRPSRYSNLKIKAVRPSGVSLVEGSSGSDSNSAVRKERPSRYSNLKVKGVRPAGVALLEESSERNDNAAVRREHPSRYSNLKIKAVRSNGTSQAKESPKRNTNVHDTVARPRPSSATKANDVRRKSNDCNTETRPSRSSAMKTKAVRSAMAPRMDKSPERSNIMPIKKDSPKSSPNERRTKRSVGGSKEQRQGNGNIQSSRRPKEQRQSNGSIVSVIQDKPSRSTSSRIQSRDAAFLEENFQKAVRESIRSETVRTAELSGRSLLRSRFHVHKGTKNQDRLARRNPRTVTTADGVDHHCQCNIM